MGNQIIIIKNSNTWIEGNAVQQLEITAKLPHMQRVAGMPDLHAGRGYPVGAAFFSIGHFYPALIGNDIGCGMAFWQTDLAAHKAKTGKLVKQLGSIDAPLGEDWQARINELLPQHPFQAALGTIGGGNHFAELQAVDTVYAPDSLPAAFNPQCLQLLVHSGSRSLGQHILRHHVDKFNHAGLPENTPEAAAYLAEHDNALAFARANRRLIAERMLKRWNAEGACLLDVHHNFFNAFNWITQRAGCTAKAQRRPIAAWWSSPVRAAITAIWCARLPTTRRRPCFHWRTARGANGNAANAKRGCRTNFPPTACAKPHWAARWCAKTKPCFLKKPRRRIKK